MLVMEIGMILMTLWMCDMQWDWGLVSSFTGGSHAHH